MFIHVTLSLLEGMWTAVELFLLTLVFSLPLGLLIAFGSMSKWAPLRHVDHLGRLGKLPAALRGFRPISALTNFVVWIIRGTPLMLLLFIVFRYLECFDWSITGSNYKKTAIC